MLRILPSLQKSCQKAFPPMPADVDTLAMYRAISFEDLWEDAEVPQCIEYLRGNKSLQIPAEWKPHLLPSTI